MFRHPGLSYNLHDNMRFQFADKTLTSKKVLEALGERDSFMVYKPGHDAKEHYASDMFLCDEENTLGLGVAKLLEELIPECVYPNIGDRIWIYDVINSLQIPEDCRVLADARYLVGVKKEEDVHIYIYKK